MIFTQKYRLACFCISTCIVITFHIKAQNSYEPRSALQEAYENNNLQLVGELLDQGADPYTSGELQRLGIFQLAIAQKREDMVKLIASRMRNVNAQDIHIGATPLMWAIRYGDEEVVRILLSRGADIHIRSSYNKTTLMEAAEKGQPAIVRILLELGAHVDIKTNKGWSAMMWAAENGNVKTISLLLEANPDLDVKNNNNETALDVARKNNKFEAETLIEEEMNRRWWLSVFKITIFCLVIVVISFLIYKFRYHFQSHNRSNHDIPMNL